MANKHPGVIDLYAAHRAKDGAAKAARYRGRYRLIFWADGRQRWVTVRDTTLTGARKRREDLMAAARAGTLPDTGRKVTLIDWLRRWMDQTIAPLRRPQTANVYRGIIEGHIAPSPIAGKALASLRASDIEAYLAGLRLAPASVGLHLALVRSALQKALRDRLVARNVARDGIERPKLAQPAPMRDRCWTAAEAARFLTVAKQRRPMVAAYFGLLLDAGLRRQEIAGLQWKHVDLDTGTLRVEHQLAPRERTADGGPTFGPTKTGRSRELPLAPETVELLRAHRASQNKLRLANGKAYEDHGLLFAREPADLAMPQTKLGQPLPTEALALREFRRIVGAAGVRPITLHSLRHTTASLLIAAGENIVDVAARLGHTRASMTLDVYAHSVGTQADAARRLGRVLHATG